MGVQYSSLYPPLIHSCIRGVYVVCEIPSLFSAAGVHVTARQLPVGFLPLSVQTQPRLERFLHGHAPLNSSAGAMAEGGGKPEAVMRKENGEVREGMSKEGKVVLSDDMLYKLSKKIAQLTKVCMHVCLYICMLFIESEDNGCMYAFGFFIDALRV